MVNLRLLLIVFAVVCFGVSAWLSTSPIWQRLVSVGWAAWALAALL